MSGQEDRLSLDITDALQAIERVDEAFQQVAVNLQQSLNAALNDIQLPDQQLEFTADAESVTPAIDEAVAAADTNLELTADSDPITASIDEAVAAADPTIDVKADVTAAQDAIDSLSGTSIDVDVEASGLEDVSAGLDGVKDSAEHAGSAGEHAGEQFAALGIAAKLSAGEIGAGKEALEGFGASGATAAAGIAAVAVAGHELFTNALNARSAQERFNLVLGDSAEAVENINIGGLNTDLKELGLQLGTAGPAMENAASKIFSLGTNSGTAAPKVAETTKEIISLAARAVALNPALGNVGSVAERALSGLARGGRFAANLGLSLNAAEIAARALADTGKSVSSELTLYEKAAAGAEIATERLGGALSTDINVGSENIKTQFASVRARFEETLETLGQPLLDPILNAIKGAQPTIESLAGMFADILPPIVEVAAALASSLQPAFDLLAPVISVVGDALGVIADVLGVLPGPIKTAAVATVLLAVAFDKLTTSLLASSLTGGLGATLQGLGVSLGTLSSIALPAAVGIGLTVGAIALIKSNAKQADDAVQGYLDSWVQVLAQQTTIAGYEEAIQGVTDAANQYGDTANKLNSPEGRLFHSGDLRQATETATGLRSILTPAQQVAEEAKRLQTEYGLTDVAALHLAESGDEVVKSFEAQAGAAKNVTEAMDPATHATDEFWLAATSGALSATDIAERADAMGIKFEDLATAVQKARQPVVDFANDIQSALPGAEKALNDLGENQGLKKFLQNLDQNLADSAAFVGNLQQLIDRGATTLADTIAGLAKTDPTKAAALASQAVKESAKALDSDEAKAKAAQAGRGLVDIAAQNVADELRGGKFDLAFAQTQDAIGEKFLKMPGQLESSVTVASGNIAAQLATSLATDPSLTQILPASLKELGANAAASFDEGFTGDDQVRASIIAAQKAQSVIDSVKKVFNIHSPSQVMRDIGQDVAAGFFLGLADVKGETDAVKPIVDVIDKFSLTASDVANAAGDSIDQITESLRKLGEQQEKLSPDQLLKVGEAVKALGGAKGVKDLQNELIRQTGAAFKGLDTKQIAEVVDQITAQAVVARAAGVFGVTPSVPKPFETNVVKGGDATALNRPVVEQNITVTPPADATPAEIAGEIAVASQWAFSGVSG